MKKLGWPEDDEQCRFEALRILREERGEPPPSWDDFKVGKDRE